MRIASWNLNGIRAVASKGLIEIIDTQLGKPDIICFQETKAQDDQVSEALLGLHGYHISSNSAETKGYSGVAILSKQKPLSVEKGMGIKEFDHEGRVLTLEFDDFYVVSVYTPNSQNELRRLPYRKEWDQVFIAYLNKLRAKKPVICCGDLNVAHQEIDIARPKSNYNKSAGYTQEEIDGFSQLLSSGFIDTFRHFHPTSIEYSWWSYRMNAREKNIGWRIDYILASHELKDKLKNGWINSEVFGSDHCPIGLELI